MKNFKVWRTKTEFSGYERATSVTAEFIVICDVKTDEQHTARAMCCSKQ
jgi:hypothetical protein